MAMEISNNYGSYVSSYTNSANSKKPVTEETGAAKETSPADRKTAADELSYLSGKYSNYSFVAADYTKGMQYGSSSTVNVAISPQFLAKMASDPELEKEYEENIAAMQKCDEQNARQVAAGGWHVAAQGWAIDKDGGISKWSIVQKDDTKSHLQTMSENAEKIREKNAEKKKAQKELGEKRQAAKEGKAELKEKMQKAGKAQFGDRFQDAIVVGKEDENVAGGRGKTTAIGWNLDIKA